MVYNENIFGSMGKTPKLQTVFHIEECEDCEGEGEIYNDTSRQCTKYIGDCCGGCGYYSPCEACNGTGEIEIEEELEV